MLALPIAWLASLFTHGRALPRLEDGRLYRFTTLWESGSVYRFDAPGRLTSLSWPGEDLAVAPDGRVLVPESGAEFGHLRDLVPAEL